MQPLQRCTKLQYGQYTVAFYFEVLRARYAFRWENTYIVIMLGIHFHVFMPAYAQEKALGLTAACRTR
jgi:hypothetical protein